jgi:hypothetical protein
MTGKRESETKEEDVGIGKLMRDWRGPKGKVTVRVKMPGMRQLRRLLLGVDRRATSAADAIAALNGELDTLREKLGGEGIPTAERELIERELKLVAGETELSERPELPQIQRAHKPHENMKLAPGSDWIEIAGINCDGIPTVTLLSCTETLGGDRLPLECFVCNVDDVLTIAQRKAGDGECKAHPSSRAIAAAIAGLNTDRSGYFMENCRGANGRVLRIHESSRPVERDGYEQEMAALGTLIVESMCSLIKHGAKRIEPGEVITVVFPYVVMKKLIEKREQETASTTGESQDLIPKVKVEVPMPPVKPPRLSDEDGMRMFSLVRHEDETGVSGTGIVAQGVRFASGKCAMCWLTDTSSVAVYDSMEDLIKIHGHNGKTEVMWHD